MVHSSGCVLVREKYRHNKVQHRSEGHGRASENVVAEVLDHLRLFRIEWVGRKRESEIEMGKVTAIVRD